MLTTAPEQAWIEITHERLMQVQAQLKAAIGALISMRLSDGPRERDALLGETATLLEDVYARCRQEQQHAGQLDPDSRPAGLQNAQTLSLLRGIQGQARQLQLLNETAIGLCRGWLSAAPAPADDYTPEGVWVNVQEPGGLRISA